MNLKQKCSHGRNPSLNKKLRKVKDGRLTYKKAKEILNAIKNNQTNYDGNHHAAIGKKYCVGFGPGNGMDMGRRAGRKSNRKHSIVPQ